MATMNVPTSIAHAITFLTRPLILTESAALISTLKAILGRTLLSLYHSLPHPAVPIKLSFSATSLPASPILAACIATGIHWADWMRLLGGRDFDLIVETQRVVVRYAALGGRGLGAQTVLVWSAPAQLKAAEIQRSILRPSASLIFGDEALVPISKLGQQSATTSTQLRSTVSSAMTRAQTREAQPRVQTQTRTFAQQILESEHPQEADELLSLISKATGTIMSPTPTRETFDHKMIELPSLTNIMPLNVMTSFAPISGSPISSPATSDSSRPSSRSSNFSTYSFSDSDESLTSVSSAASSCFDFLASTKPSATTTYTAPSPPISAAAPIFVPRSLPPRLQARLHRAQEKVEDQEQEQPATIIVDNNKKDVTKYLYQGGVSTVLTGGVMLGAASVKPAPKPAQKVPTAAPAFTMIPVHKRVNTVPVVPKYRAPIGGHRKGNAKVNGNANPITFTKGPTANASSWRRAGPLPTSTLKAIRA